MINFSLFRILQAVVFFCLRQQPRGFLFSVRRYAGMTTIEAVAINTGAV